MRRLVPLALAACIAAVLVWTGTHDLECYENAFCSLARGTQTSTVNAFGQPVYTLSIGLGTRLPLHGNLGASPAAMVARVLPEPVTHWLLLALAMGAAALVVVHALRPLGGPIVAWGAVLALFWSPPMVTYTVFNDWPETAVTYCALVGGIFAPHALLLAGAPGHATTRWTRRALLAVTFSLLAMAHPGYWPQLVAAVALSSLLLFARSADRPRDRWTILAAVACAGALALAIHVPDLAREQALGTGLVRDGQGAAGSLLASNRFPWNAPDPRAPFTMLAVALVSILAVCAASRRWWLVVWSAAALSLGFGIAAAWMPYFRFTVVSFDVAPSTIWTLRDPAIVFATMSGAFACAGLIGATTTAAVRWTCAAALILCAAQSAGYASALMASAPAFQATPWNHDWSNQTVRASRRGIRANVEGPGIRVALWPGVRQDMRLSAHASTIWPDAGYQLVTAWTKNRTMAGLVRPNDVLFDQTTDLSSEVLCDAVAAPFLRLRYLVMPDGQRCDGWTGMDGARIDDRWSMAQFAVPDMRAFAVRLDSLTPREKDDPAFGGDLTFIHHLAALPGSSLALQGNKFLVALNEQSSDPDLALVLPVAYDPAWQTSSGRTRNLAGLLAVDSLGASRVELTFAPDLALRLRALGMLAAQIAGAVGIALASVFLGADNRAVPGRNQNTYRNQVSP